MVLNSISRMLTGASVRTSSSSTFLSPPSLSSVNETSLYFVTTRAAFTSAGSPSLPIAASFNTRGMEALLTSFNSVGTVTAPRRETTNGISFFTANHCDPEEDNQSSGDRNFSSPVLKRYVSGAFFLNRVKPWSAGGDGKHGPARKVHYLRISLVISGVKEFLPFFRSAVHTKNSPGR